MSKHNEKDVEQKQVENKTPADNPNPVEGGRPRGKSSRPPRRQGPGGPRDMTPPEFLEKVITINRVTKVTKGGKKLGFSALVVVGDGKGRVGYGLAKASEVANAIKKSLIAAKKSMIKIPLKGTTILHEVIGEWGSAIVMLKPAAEGTGVIAAGSVRAICEAAGIRNILTKCHRSNNPVNVIKATMDGFTQLKIVEESVTTEIKAKE